MEECDVVFERHAVVLGMLVLLGDIHSLCAVVLAVVCQPVSVAVHADLHEGGRDAVGAVRSGHGPLLVDERGAAHIAARSKRQDPVVLERRDRSACGAAGRVSVWRGDQREVTVTSMRPPVSPPTHGARMVKGGAPPTMRAVGPLLGLDVGPLPTSCFGIASLVLLRL